ncbi:hypothetical protein [Paenibacillus tepidiphilus]|uniref:hypothetical protein n=1 Tax=Paenibacillus tepidiphilus TaxID=2608683 RepID=UPI00123A5F19|nr:hypothetical protein [Paenibacillus tepidiphilus]
MTHMHESKDSRTYLIINVLAVFMIVIFVSHMLMAVNHSAARATSYDYEFSHIMYQNKDTTTLFVIYSDDGLGSKVALYTLVFIITEILLLVSFAIRRSLSTFLLILMYILNIYLFVYPYFHLKETQEAMFLTSTHFLLLTGHVNDYSLAVLVPYYALMIGLTLYFVRRHLPQRKLRRLSQARSCR